MARTGILTCERESDLVGPASSRHCAGGTVDGSAVSFGERHNGFCVEHDYPIFFTEKLFDRDNALLVQCLRRREPMRRHRLLFVIDSGVAAARPTLVEEIGAYVEYWSEAIALAAAPLVVPGGEACKNDLSLVATLAQTLHLHKVDRQSFVVAIGGGAVLDLAGFVAGIAHRGVRLVRIPTTVLAQNDAGIGVKNAVNAFGCKNFLGTFAPPWAVINDLDFIATLSARDVIAGMAEAVKVALIRDAEFFSWLEEHAVELAAFERPALARLIRRCAELHLDHIASSGDPFETGSARPLDYGHWSAHKLEALTRHDVRHGEAVAIGVVLDAFYAAATGLLDHSIAFRVADLLERLGFRLWRPELEARDAETGRSLVLGGLDEFREHLGGELTISLLTAIGAACEVNALDPAVIMDCIEELKQRDQTRCG